MATFVTAEKIAGMSLESRSTLYRNCMDRMDNEDAVKIVEMILASGLPFGKEREIAAGDPELQAMEEVINAKENKALLLAAVTNKLPPLGAIEPLIIERLGNGYRLSNGGPNAAGELVTKRLEKLGYEKRPNKRMPEGSLAKTAATFRKKAGPK
jgi:hypothetical protein